MDDFASDTDSDYTSYWRDWVSLFYFSSMILLCLLVLVGGFWWGVVWIGGLSGCRLGLDIFRRSKGARNDDDSRAGWVL
jgi:hypothetical protein